MKAQKLLLWAAGTRSKDRYRWCVMKEMFAQKPQLYYLNTIIVSRAQSADTQTRSWCTVPHNWTQKGICTHAHQHVFILCSVLFLNGGIACHHSVAGLCHLSKQSTTDHFSPKPTVPIRDINSTRSIVSIELQLTHIKVSQLPLYSTDRVINVRVFHGCSFCTAQKPPWNMKVNQDGLNLYEGGWNWKTSASVAPIQLRFNCVFL